MKFFQVKTVEETFSLISQRIESVCETHLVPLEEAIGRTLACDMIARENTPDFVRSTVDGYALKASDTFGASDSMPAFLTVVGEVKMGEHNAMTLDSGQAIYVPTGGMLPVGSDAMLMIEHAELNGNLLCAYKQVAPMENMIQVGEDFLQGNVFLQKGTVLRAQEIGALAANGFVEVSVYRKPIIAFLSTGDEIVPVDTVELPVGKVREMNTMMISSRAKQLGCEVIIGGIAPDDPVLLEEICRDLLSQADCLMLSGGSSVGAKDYSVDIINRLGRPGVYVHGVSVKPGKPTIIASADGKPVIGLPGHPASALIIFDIIGKKVINALKGATLQRDVIVYAQVPKRFPSAVGRTDYIRVKLIKQPLGYQAEPIIGKSGLISTLVKCDGLLMIPENKEGIEKGELAEVILIH